jgi:tRNA (guanine-N7-)-methyltransferase
VRLRRKPWIDEAIKEYADFVYTEPDYSCRGRWKELFTNRNGELHVELGIGKGRFIAETAALYPDINFVGIEAQQDVLYYAAKKVRERGLSNVRLLVFDINNLLDIFALGEVQRFYINFCDPWPKKRHAKRRLTHALFLAKYRQILAPQGQLFFKTDNERLFEFSLNEFAANDLKLANINLDLHHSDFPANVMTEYEFKFSNRGMKIYRCEVTFP